MGQYTYLVLILIWAVPIILIQWLVGADILLKRWKVLLPGILLPTLYLTSVDSMALRSETWTINPTQMLNIFLPIINVPLEEGVFFLVTNTLIVQGVILIWMPEMRQRLRALFRHLMRLLRRQPPAIDGESGD